MRVSVSWAQPFPRTWMLRPSTLMFAWHMPDVYALDECCRGGINVFTIWGGPIHEIKATGIVADYMSPAGWELQLT